MVIKKFTKDEALAKIKILISDFYEKVGREIFDNIDLEREQLLDEIDNILRNTDISNRQLILERLKLDKLDSDRRNG